MAVHGGFFEQRTASPLSLGGVLLLHGAVIGAVLLVQGPEWVRAPDRSTATYDVPLEDIPPPLPPPPQPDQPVPDMPLSRLDVPPPVVPVPTPSNPIRIDPLPLAEPSGTAVGTQPTFPSGTGVRTEPKPTLPTPRPVPPPVRVEARIDPSSELLPPYPASEERAEREGMVRLRITIAPSGRVIAAERLSATSDAFWRSTERHVLANWRFRPATVDGRPVESTRVMTIQFRLNGR